MNTKTFLYVMVAFLAAVVLGLRLLIHLEPDAGDLDPGPSLEGAVGSGRSEPGSVPNPFEPPERIERKPSNPEPPVSLTSAILKTADRTEAVQEVVDREDEPESVLDSLPSDPATKARLGRVALASVGADPDAEIIWLWAINDLSLASDDRQDLIEDLNEDGFPDPRNPTRDDLPLIEARIALIERYAPSAADEVNADAFAEAHRDLVAMWTRLTQP